MQKTNNWVTKGASLLCLAIALGGISGCDSSPSANSGIVTQPSPVNSSSSQGTKSASPTAPNTVSPPVTISTNSKQTSSQQNAPNSSPGAASKQSPPASGSPKIRVNPDNSLSPQLIVEQEGKTHTFKAQDLQVEVMDSVNCQKMTQVDRQALTVNNFMRDQVSTNPQTGEIAIGVILQYCALTQESAIVLLRPKTGGGYQPVMLQVPGRMALSSNNATYPLATIKDVRYTNGNLAIKHGNAAGAEAELVFRAGELASCRVITAGEGEQKFCYGSPK